MLLSGKTPATAKLVPLGGADRGERARTHPGLRFHLDQDLFFRLQPVLAIVPVLKTPVFEQAPRESDVPLLSSRR